jgi:hypothetical protein
MPAGRDKWVRGLRDGAGCGGWGPVQRIPPCCEDSCVASHGPARSPRRPQGTITRGTTNPNRLRRVDRWIVAVHGGLLRGYDQGGHDPAWSGAPLVADLGYGASPVTTVEMFRRLRSVRSDVQVTGVEIDKARVIAAKPFEQPGLTFVQGGFELQLPQPPALIRALNVLRQYTEGEAWAAWESLMARLAPGGLVIEGTCDELGRRAVWVALDATGPRTITFSARLAGLDQPSQLAERLPKTLIHRNVPGQQVHALLRDLDRAWASAASLRVYGARQRWMAACESLAGGWPACTTPPAGGPSRWRLGELTLPWSAVAPGP